VQCRLVEPKAESINSGDCYVLVTPDKVIQWIGDYCNVIEKAKVSHRQHESTLYSMRYGCYPMGEHCRIRSAGSSVLSDQDLDCSLLDLKGYC
jgi:hypothetical protein